MDNGGSEEDVPVVIIEAGSGNFKAGFSTQDEPSSFFPSIVGRVRQDRSISCFNRQFTCYVGNETLTRKGLLNMVYPIQRGVTTDWVGIEQALHHTFYNELRVAPEEHPVLLTESPSTTHEEREKTVEMMFETFQVPELYLGNTAALSLYASGRTTGLVFDSGEGVSHVVPVSDGHALRHATMKMEIGGKDVTDLMIREIHTKGIRTFVTSSEKELVRSMKERCGYVALDYEEELKKAKESEQDLQVEYDLPDGTTIALGRERFKCTELLFKPSLINESFSGVHTQIHQSLLKCDVNIRDELCQNILLSGGNTMFSGLAARLHKEISALNVSDTISKIIAPPVGRNYSSWIGGSVITCLPNFSDLCIKKEEYDEGGSKIARKRFI